MNRVIIGDQDDQHVSIVILRRDSHDTGDQAWLLTRVSVRAGQWTGKFKACIRMQEFVAFRRRLKSLKKSPDRVATYGSLDNWLELRLSAEPCGQLLVRGAAIDECGTGNLLKFNFKIDQSELPKIITQLEGVVQTFLGE